MSAACPDRECHDTVTKLALFMKIVGAGVIVLSGIVWGITQYAMSAEKKQNDKISEIPVIQKDIEHIKASVKEIKETINKMKEQTITKDDIDRLIKAVKNKNGK